MCFKLLSKDCNGALVLGQAGFEVGEEVVVVLNDGRQSVQLRYDAMCDAVGRWCLECRFGRNLADASKRANAAVVLLGRRGKMV